MPKRDIAIVLSEHTPKLLTLPGVVGTGVGSSDGTPCISVFVHELTDDIHGAIPTEIEGHPVIITETGQFRAGL